MPFPQNAPSVDDLLNLPLHEIALLSPDLLAEMQREISAASKQMKTVSARFNAALEARYAARAAEERRVSGKDTGTVRFEDGDCTIVADLPKRVDWNQAKLASMVARDGTLSLIPFSERGSAYEQQIPERRDVRAFVCRQFKKQDVIWASEIQQVRDFGSESATQQVQAEVARKLGRLRNDAETTFEYHLFNGIQGLVKDPRDGATVVNYFTEFGITPATEVDFDLDNATPASGALRKRCQALIESVEDTMGGLATGAIQLRAECGSAFFADLVAHKEVRETYLNTAAAADLRSRVADEVSFGGITFRRYRGGAGFGVATDKAVFYPEAVDGLFEIYHAPADTFETVNTLGQPLYARMIPDRDRDEWIRLEIESNPLPICTRPQVLRSARRT